MKKSAIFTMLLLALGFVHLPNAAGHYLSLNVDNYFPNVGEEITVSIGMGHKFPESTSYAVDKMDRIYVIGPDGKETTLEMKPVDDDKLVAPIKVKFDNPGTYLIVAEKKKSFITKTTEGYKYKAKDELKNPIKSYWSEGNAKAVVVVGKPSGNAFQKKIDTRYQVMLDIDPSSMTTGSMMYAKVIFDGKLHNTQVFSTYAGFSEEMETYAYVTRSKDGLAKVKMLEKGPWLIKTSDTFPYPDPKKADVNSFTSTVTFGVK